MKLNKSILIIASGALLCGLLWACNKREVITPQDYSYQYAYLPQQIGKYVEYQADSIVYSFIQGEGVQKNAFTLHLKNLIADTIRGSNEELQYKTEQYQRASDTLPWVLTKVFTTRVEDNKYEKTEENIRYLQLIFPMTLRSEWDGLTYIDVTREIEIREQRMRPFSNWGYEIDSINVALQVGNFAFDSVLVVTEADDVNAIERRLSRSKYAIDIGLIEREQWILDSQYCNDVPVPTDCETKPWEEKAERGYILRQWITGHN